MKILLKLSVGLFIVMFFVSVASAQKGFAWNGIWYASDEQNSLILKVKTLSKTKFAFSFNIKNDEKNGKIEGVGFFDKGVGTATKPENLRTASELTRPCIVVFRPEGKNLQVKHNLECQRYTGKSLVFAGSFSKTKKPQDGARIFDLKSLPTTDLENQLKNLVGEDYELFKSAMQERKYSTADNSLFAKRYNNCLSAYCEWDRVFVHHYDKELKFAAVFFKGKDGKQFIHYYSNLNPGFIGIPTDITNWANALKVKYGEITLVYKNEKNKK